MREQGENLEVREAAIKQELERVKAELGEKWVGYFNNFWMYLKPKEGDPYMKQISIQLQDINKKPAEYVEDPKSLEKMSELRLSQTDAEFFQTLDATVDELGLDRRRIQELLARLSKSNQRQEVFQNYLDLIEPLYVRLRAKGYSHKELTT